MKGRKPSGEGTINFNPKTNRYVAQIRWVDPVTKKIKSKSFTEAKLADARRRLEQFKKNELEMKKSAGTNYDKVLFNDYLENWLVSTKAPVLMPTTYATQWSLYRNSIRVYFEDCILAYVNSEHIQKFINGLVDRNYSFSYIKQCYDLINGVFRDYIERYNLSGDNPCKKVTLPYKRKRDIADVRFFDRKERDAIIQEATLVLQNGRQKYRIGYGVVFLLFTGLRYGEAAALTWEDIDFEQKTIRVNKHLVLKDHLAGKTSGHKPNNLRYEVLVEKGAKTRSGVRFIPMATKAAEAALELRKNSDGCKYVLSTSNHRPMMSTTFNKTFQRILKNAGITFKEGECHSVHTLRHTFASMMIESGADLKTVSEILGHSSSQFTANIYVHLTQEHKAKMINNLDDYVDA